MKSYQRLSSTTFFTTASCWPEASQWTLITIGFILQLNLSTTATFGHNFLAVVKRWTLWGLQKEDLSEWIRSRDRKTWPLKRGGRCGEVAVSGGSTVDDQRDQILAGS